jgi:hypothetical protein
MKLRVLVAFLLASTGAIGCRQRPAEPMRPQVGWSGWVEESAVKRGHVKAGDIAQFGCPPGWRGVEDTAAAMRGKHASAVYVGNDPPPGDATVTCVALADFTLPAQSTTANAPLKPPRRPLAPVWLEMGAEAMTVGFRSELPLGAAIYFARETPCGPRVIGVRLADLLNWLVDPESAPTRDFLGMTSSGCPEKEPPSRR